MHLLGLVLPPFLFVFLHLSPAFAQSNAAIVTSSTSPELNKYPTPTPIPSNTFQPWEDHFSNKTRSKIAATEFNILPSEHSGNLNPDNPWYDAELDLPEGSLEPFRGAIATSGKVSSGPSDTMAQITISTQDQNSVTSSPIFTAPQPFGNRVIDNTVTQPPKSIFQRTSSSSTSAVAATQIPSRAVAQSTSSSSTLATVVTQLSNNPISQSPSSINHQSSSSFNNDTPPTHLAYLPFNTVTHKISSMDYQISSSSSSNSNPSHILPSDSMLNDHPPSQTFSLTTLFVVPRPLATQTTVPEGTASGAVGLANAVLAGMGILPPQASAPPGKLANGAIGSVGSGIEIVQIFPTTTLIVSTVSSVPAAATSAVEGPIVLISAGTGIIPSGKSATLGASANSAIPSGGSVGGGDKGGGGGNGSSVITGSGSTTGSGTPTDSGPGRTNVPTVSTGGAEGVHTWANWWLEFGILVWGVGMVYWM